MSTSKNQNYLHGAAILTIAVVITKVFGAIYKIPLANIMGTEGYAHFSVAYNLYTVLLTLSTAGLPIALAKMVSEANNLNRPSQVKRIFSVATWAFILLGVIWTLVMIAFPTELAIFMGDVEASQSVLALAPAVILVCIMSSFRGYTQGLSDMRPTSVSQVVEVAVKVVFGLVVLIMLNNRGFSAPNLSAGAISGVAAGSLAACLYLAVVAKKRVKSENLRYAGSSLIGTDIPDKRGAVLRRLIKIGIPIALGSCVLSVITLINTKLICERLQNGAGFSYNDAIALFGEYSMTLPLYNLPAALITPLTVSVVPAIAGFLAKKQFGEAKTVVESSLRISTIIAMPMAVGLSVLAVPIMSGLYKDSTNQGATLLAILGVASFFVCLALMTTAILQAGGRERLPMITMLIGGALNIGINWYLLGRVDVNIYGAPVGTLICYIIMSGLNMVFLMTKMPEKPSLVKVFIKPVFNCTVMGLTAWIIYPVALKIIAIEADPTRIKMLIALLIAIFVSVVVYLVLTIVTKAVTMADMKLIPKGEKVAKVLHIR